ncbi:MAG: SDR family oxidoreductase [bacterium]|nr:SDR family oxidoreductase [bacterium]MCP5043242.1 SDR family oxidoreductase [bacterium]
MSGRLEGKATIVVGAGQTPGETIGNGRATAILFAREGARVLVVDRDQGRAEQTQAMIREEGGQAEVHRADVTVEDDCRSISERCVELYGRIDVLHNNVGIGGGDAGPTQLTEEDWDQIMDTNLKSVFLTCKYALPVMREQRSGVITNISSVAAVCAVGIVAYKTSKAGLNAYTHALATGNTKYGIRANVIMPGLMNTPMAIEGISQARGVDRETLIKQRDLLVPLGQKMGTAWDIANAALFLASDEAGFITGVVLPVDGGQSARIG